MKTIFVDMNRETYDRMLERAVHKGIQVLGPAKVDGKDTGAWLVQGSTGLYAVKRDSCSCSAHERYGYCSHRAAVIDRVSQTYRGKVAFKFAA